MWCSLFTSKGKKRAVNAIVICIVLQVLIFGLLYHIAIGIAAAFLSKLIMGSIKRIIMNIKS